MRTCRAVLAPLVIRRLILVVEVHQPRTGVVKSWRHAVNGPLAPFVVGGHDGEQFHEFSQEVDHAYVAVFW